MIFIPFFCSFKNVCQNVYSYSFRKVSASEIIFDDSFDIYFRKSGLKSRSKSIASPIKDPVSDLEDAQNNLPNQNEDEEMATNDNEMATNENEEEITAANKDEEEITEANKDVDQESELTIPKPMLNDGFGIEVKKYYLLIYYVEIWLTCKVVL